MGECIQEDSMNDETIAMIILTSLVALGALAFWELTMAHDV